MDEHLFHLEHVLSCLHSNNFFVKLFKCLFFQDTIDYLGHIVSASGVQANSRKIEAMVHWPPPQNTKQLRGFLGLTGYYCCFIKGYASLASHLTDLSCKDAFQWTLTAATTFQALKQAMVEASVLRLLDFNIEFVVETNALNAAIGVMCKFFIKWGFINWN